MDLANQSNRAGNSLLTDSHEIGTERTKTIPCPAAHVWIGHIREFSPPPGVECTFFKTKKFNKSLTTYTKTHFQLPGLQNILCF